MHTVTLFNLWQEEWLLREKVEFDGATRRIYLHPGMTTLTVRSDIYSAWKRWVFLQKNSGYAEAIRVTGGDSTGPGTKSGDIYFLRNGWQIVVDEPIAINGILYHDDVGVSPYIIRSGGGVIATVSSLTQLVEVGGGGGSGSSASEIWNYAGSTTAPGSIGSAIRQMAVDTANIETLSASIKTDSTATRSSVTTIGQNLTALDDKVELVALDALSAKTASEAAKVVVETTDGKVDVLAAATNLIDDKVDALGVSVTSMDVKIDSLSSSTESLQTDVVAIASNLTTVTQLVNTLLKYEKNRTRVDQNAKTLTVYDDDGVTPLQVFNLRNFVGSPSVTEVAERSPT